MISNVLAVASFDEILDDLSSRFIVNVPEQELKSLERICFQVEQAHWFYEDFVRLLQPNLPSFHLKTFSEQIFKHCPLLKQWANEHERTYADFLQYRFRIPVCGAILLNGTLDKCVLVKGWSQKSGWSFPKGKINQDEEFDHCAIREVMEETGYDITPLITDAYIEITMREQSIRLYIIVGVPEDTQFKPQTRKEISDIQWFKLDELPGYKSGQKLPGRFYMVLPFVSKLKQYLPTLRKETQPRKNEHSRNKSSAKAKSNGRNHQKPSNSSGMKQQTAEKPAKTSTAVPPPSPPQDCSEVLKSLLGIPVSGQSETSTPALAKKDMKSAIPLT